LDIIPGRGCRSKNGRKEDTMSVLSTKRRKIGAIALIAAGLIAVAIPFLLHAPTNANPGTTTNGNNNTNSNTNTNTNPSQTSNQNTGTTGSGDNEGSSTCHVGEKDDNDTSVDPPSTHSQGQAKAHDHGNGDHGKGDHHGNDLVHSIAERLSRLGAYSNTYHNHNSTRTDNGHLEGEGHESPQSTNSNSDPCQGKESETETD
jgi:hypothetical protein